MPKETETLSSALKKLEQLIDELNNQEPDIEDALKKFNDGVALVRYCRQELQHAENEFIRLQRELDRDNGEERDDSVYTQTSI